jgi:outer membrane protein OmpA-like peptidoglycan-associated protein
MTKHPETKEGTMLDFKALKAPLSMAISFSLLSVLVGCAGMEFAPRQGAAWFPRELPAADRALEAARQAGKDKECPEEFKAAEKMKNDAYGIYLSCHTEEGIAMANEAANRAKALCPKKVVEAAPTVPPPVAVKPPPPAPTVALSASPASIKQGQCTTLTWSSGNASRVSIDQGVGRVDPNGSRQICPDSTTQYTIAAVGEGESRTESTTVTVKPKVIDRLTLHVNFDFDKANVRDADTAELQSALDFVKKYPGYEISIEGHTDSVGSEKYNQRLSERRAAAVKGYLLKHGVTDGARIKTTGHGKSQPIADNSTEEGRFKNRRVEILILSE